LAGSSAEGVLAAGVCLFEGEMRRRIIIGVFAGVLLLSGCQMTDRGIRGSHDESLLVGQITMAGELAGVSPAGIEVRVITTGAAAVSDEDGSFVLASLPRGSVELQLQREDGIFLTHSLAPGSRSLAVELSARRD
jgi:hypothetical protein